MLFNSWQFIFIFLPTIVLGALLVQRYGRDNQIIPFLVLASLVFYGWWNWKLLGLLVASVVLNYGFARLLSGERRRIILFIAIVANLAALGWFKYAHFLADNARSLTGIKIELGDIVLPLAISFFTFQQIAYLVDVYKGHSAEKHFWRYSLFVVFFPQLIAGPIVHHSEMLPQFRNSNLRLRVDNLSIGIAIFAVGLFKKVLIADPVGVYSDLVFSSAAYGTPITFVTAWFGVASFALEIYFDFSAYTDMAIGLARMFGVSLPINFNSPYKAVNIIDFWRRWHITLSRFLRDYLYIPLGGNRSGIPRQFVNIMIVMLIGGLWHGAAWTFVVWGGLHGGFLIVNHVWRILRARYFPAAFSLGLPGRVSAQALTLVSVLIAWAFFRADSWESALIIVHGLFGLNGLFLPESYGALTGSFAPSLQALGVTFGVEPDAEAYPTLPRLLTVIAIFMATCFLPNTQEWFAKYDPALGAIQSKLVGLPNALLWRPGMVTGVITALLLLASFSTFLTAGNDAFIYFQF